jgi:hypothetical protein
MRLLSIVLGSGLLFSGCGSETVCDKADNAIQALANTDCAAGAYALGTKPTTMTKAQCESGIDKCSSADKDKLAASFDCLTALPKCETGKELDYLGRFIECTAKAVGVACGG